jgi:hypothetical protein
MLKRIFAFVVLGVVLAAPRLARTDEDPNFCATGWYEVGRVPDEQAGCERVYFYCDWTGRTIGETHCGGGYGLMY